MYVTRNSAVCFVTVLVLNACTPTTQDTSLEDSTCTLNAPLVHIGSGEQTFEYLEPEAPVTMVHGPQGGWHILGSLRIEHIQDVVEIAFQIFDVDSGIMISDNVYRVGLIMEDTCSGFYPGMYGYLNVSALESEEGSTPPELLENHLLRMYMRVNDCTQSQSEQGLCIRDDRWGESEIFVRAALDPIDMD